MRAVDTNLLVRLVARDDARQVATAERFVAGGAWISLIVLTELTWVLDSVYDLPAPEIGLAVEMLLNHATLTVQDSDVVLAALEQFRAKPVIGFADCLVLEVARRAGHTPLGTFDRKLGRLSGAEQL